MNYMELAISLANKSNPSPNPKVGAVIVKKGKIIGKGYHKKPRMPHAEIEAINNAEKKGFDVKNSTIYLNLEPCCHKNKRTPPCVDALYGFSKVVCAMKDPNPQVNGKGIRKLRKNGVKVEVGMLEGQARELNKGYMKSITEGLPFIAIKMAASLDGKTATRTGNSKWISSGKSRKIVKELRNEYDAVMVGIGTVLADNPSLGSGVKIIADSRLRISSNAKLLKSGRTIIISKKQNKSLEKKGVVFLVSDLKTALKKLPSLGISTILAEGGAELNGSLFDEKLIDRLYLFTAPLLIGGKNAKTIIEGKGNAKLKDSVKIKNMKIKKTGNDVLFEGDVSY